MDGQDVGSREVLVDQGGLEWIQSVSTSLAHFEEDQKIWILGRNYGVGFSVLYVRGEGTDRSTSIMRM